MTAPQDRLTPQEARVVVALRSGSTNREVAEQLFVSVKTIETHLTRIYRKLGFRSRAQVVAAYHTGTIPGLGPALPAVAPVTGGAPPPADSRRR